MNDETEPLIRVMGLHSITYCERLFYLEEVEKILIADDHPILREGIKTVLELKGDFEIVGEADSGFKAC